MRKKNKIEKIILFSILIFANRLINDNILASNKIKKIGEKAPNLVLYDLDNKIFNLKKIKNEGFTLISFSATYCKPCKEEIKEFIKLKKEIGENKLKIYLIFVDLDIKEIKSYVKKNKVDLPVLHDKYKIVSQKYNVRSLPVSFLIDKEGIIIYKIIGFHKDSIENITKKIK